VDVTFDATPAGFASVVIKDSGVGMTKDQIEQARLPFHANWSGLSREADGAGLGLTIADRIVKNLGGKLIIESEADAGTVITVSLPVYRSDGANVTEVSPLPKVNPANDAAPLENAPDKRVRTRSSIR
jgi:signal transduction histidine kinase